MVNCQSLRHTLIPTEERKIQFPKSNIDIIVVISKAGEEHFRSLNSVLCKLHESDLKLSQKKSTFHDIGSIELLAIILKRILTVNENF